METVPDTGMFVKCLTPALVVVLFVCLGANEANPQREVVDSRLVLTPAGAKTFTVRKGGAVRL